MAELKIPVDFERLPDYQQFVELLRAERGLSEIPEVWASFVFTRLLVDLAYQAGKTNHPGLLTDAGAELFKIGLEDYLDGQRMIDLLIKCELLTRCNDSVQSVESLNRSIVESSYTCPRFAAWNSHLAGDHKPAHLRGADHSAHVRRKRQVASDVARQATLLPPEIYRDKAGNELNAAQINRVLVIIKTLDNCLRRAGRTQHEFSEGLLADASEVASSCTDERLEVVYRWLIDKRGHPAIPQTAEQVLAGWAGVEEGALGKG